MLLLVTILLVVVGTISLVIGFVQSSLLPIYISIACSVLAAVVLLIFSRMTAKSQQVVTAGDGPSPLDRGADRTDRGEREPAFAGTGLLAGGSESETFAPESRYGSGSRLDEGDDGDVEGMAPDLVADDTALDDDFPIERYDSRRVGEILPLLAELDLDELDIVREHEEQGKGRATVLARIDQLIDQLEADDRHEAAHRLDADDAPAPAVAALDDADDADDIDDVDGLDDRNGSDAVSAPFASPSPLPPPTPTQAVTVAALPEDDGYFPIEDYDDLRASEILPLLPELDDDELVMVQERERSGAARSSVLRRIEGLLPESTTAAPVDLAPQPLPPLEVEPTLVPVEPAGVLGSDAGGPARKAAAKKAQQAQQAKVASARVSAATKGGGTASAAAARKAAAPTPPAKRSAAVVPPPPVKRAPAAKRSAPVVKASVAPPVKASKKAALLPIPEPPAKKAPAKKVPSAKVASARASAATKGGGTASSAAAAKTAKAAKATRKTTKG